MKKEFAIGMLLGLALGIAGLTRAYMLELEQKLRKL